MTSKLYFPGDVRYEKPVLTRSKHRNATLPQELKTIRLRGEKRKDGLPPAMHSTPVMFCGSPYSLKLTRVSMVAVDFDGTLAVQMHPYDPRRAGPPLGKDDPKSVFNLVKKMVRKKKVIILTARMNSTEHTPEQLAYTRKLIGGWTKKYFGVRLACTAEKHHLMSTIYDDRAIAVNPKTGRIK